MTNNLRICIVSLLVAVSSLIARQGRAADDDPARAHVDRAKAAFGLGRFDEAAAAYEAAFQAKPAPALLYNAAQTHRMAGHKERALDLYQSYLRLYKSGTNRDESAQHVENLSRALTEEKRAATAPPNAIAEQEPTPGAAPPAGPPSIAPMGPGPDGSLGARADEPQTTEPITSKPWFWVTVGGVAVAAVVTVLVLTLGGESAPSASAGKVTF